MPRFPAAVLLDAPRLPSLTSRLTYLLILNTTEWNLVERQFFQLCLVNHLEVLQVYHPLQYSPIENETTGRNHPFFVFYTEIAPMLCLPWTRFTRVEALLTSIAEITYQVGFANQSYLNCHFKRLVGATLGQWRRR